MLKNEKGFSLVELMIVVAIIGILAAIAIPNYQKFQERSRQAEAKGNLSGIYTAEQAFYAQYSSFYGDLDTIGFAPSGNVGYNVGFTANTPALPTGAPAGQCLSVCASATTTTTCNTGFVTWQCNMLNAAFPALPTATVSSATLFTAAAVAELNPNVTGGDVWTMDNTQTLSNPTSGL